jgi:N-formylmaleamate deformylase
MNTPHKIPALMGTRRLCVLAPAAMIVLLSMTRISAAAGQQAPAQADHPAFRVTTSGTGPAILMIPGLASSGATWDGTVAHLSPHYRCIVLTLAGFAGEPPIQGDLLTAARDQIVQYIRDNHLDRPVILGHSLGGSIALDLAARNPQLVGPVIIVDALPFFAGAWFQADSLAAAQPTIDKMRAGMEGMSHDQWLAMTRSGASTNAMASSAKDQQTLVDWGLASDQKTVTDAMISLVSTDLRPELKNIQTPVLVIGTWIGLKAYGVTEQAATDLFHQQYAGVSHFQFVMAPTARHFVMWDDPEWFNQQVDAFLAGPAAGAGQGQ